MADDRPDLGQLVKDWKPYAKAVRVCRDYDEGRHELRFATPDFASKYGSVVSSWPEGPGSIAAGRIKVGYSQGNPVFLA